MIKVTQKGEWERTIKFLTKAQTIDFKMILARYGQDGVNALSQATPKDSGETASSWIYNVSINARGLTITWSNTNIENGALVAVLIQYGHGLQNGSYVEGKDYINPAIKPVFQSIAESLFKEVTAL